MSATSPEPLNEMNRRIWFERIFKLGIPIEAFPEVLERIRGTPLRLEERASTLPTDLLTRRVEGQWSIQEHIGHLVDLEALWDGRIDDFDDGAEALRPADLENRVTWEGEHNSGLLEDLITDFTRLRGTMIERVEAMGDRELARTAFHPRLRKPMTVVDLLFFVAEHDDHHLASITELVRQWGQPL
jgi:uncharacterized damage-inducible protein DinB